MTDVETLTITTPLLKTKCTLGEGPLYDPATGILHFLDIGQSKVLHYDTVTTKLTVDQFDEPVTALALRSNGQGIEAPGTGCDPLACAAKRGFALINPVSSDDDKPTITYLAQPLPGEQLQYTRFNDGACDAKGRFLAGTLLSPTPDHQFGGSLYRYDPGTGVCELLDDDDITDSNGLGWSADHKTMYFTSSLVNKIFAYDYDLESGAVSNRREFIEGKALDLPTNSFCDGFCIDSEGCIWSARWRGSKILRFDPTGTSVTLELYFPTAFSVTACTFGGPNNDELFVTTAHALKDDATIDPETSDKYPDCGDVFVIDFKGRFTGGAWRYNFGG